MRRLAPLLAMFALGVLSVAIAQKRPDFTGAWTPPPAGVVAGTETTGSLGSGWGSSFTLRQTEDALILERVLFAKADLQPAMRFRFALDGSETRNTVLMGRGEQVQVSTVAWDGDKLVITTVYHVLDSKEGERIRRVRSHRLFRFNGPRSAEAPGRLRSLSRP